MIWNFGYILVCEVDYYGEEFENILVYSDSKEEINRSQ